ncbi:MAG: ribonuclease H family protein [Bacteroidales bacterium]|nr:ribonuclease H family protein [Bacteroidales bacterium]
MAKKKKYYVIWQGKETGIFDSWDKCQELVEGFAGAKYKAFLDRSSAETAFKNGPDNYWGKEVAPTIDFSEIEEKPVSPAITVDAACSGNPGIMEYQGVFLDISTKPATTSNIFKSPAFQNGTNNIGEFLAIVHALALQKKKGLHYPIYSDSAIGISWVRQKKCKTKLLPDSKNEYLFELVIRAEKWLNENTIEVPILKWKTDVWGEIPADFNRKH